MTRYAAFGAAAAVMVVSLIALAHPGPALACSGGAWPAERLVAGRIVRIEPDSVPNRTGTEFHPTFRIVIDVGQYIRGSGPPMLEVVDTVGPCAALGVNRQRPNEYVANVYGRPIGAGTYVVWAVFDATTGTIPHIMSFGQLGMGEGPEDPQILAGLAEAERIVQSGPYPPATGQGAEAPTPVSHPVQIVLVTGVVAMAAVARWFTPHRAQR